MNFTKDELDLVFSYSSDSKEKTLGELREIIPMVKHELIQIIVESTIMKLQAMPENECVQFMADTKKQFIKKRDASIRQRLAHAKKQSKEQENTHTAKQKKMDDREI